MSAVDTLRQALYGSPPSVGYKPDRNGTIAAFSDLVKSVDTVVGGIVGSAAPAVYASRSTLYGNLDFADRTLGLVYNDSVSDRNGIYIKSGTSGSGSWVYTGLLGRGAGASSDQIKIAVDEYVDNFTKGDPGGDASQVGTFAQAIGLNYDAGIQRIRTTGFAANADGGAATYDRWAAPMSGLPTLGQNVWWFQAADGSRWQIADAPQHMAAQFGALGGNAIDAGPILSRAFLAPMVKVINLGARTHYYTPRIDVASGKWLVGEGPEVSKLVVNPLLESETQTAPRNAVRHLNTVGGGSVGYSLDCQRSGNGRGDNNRTHGVCILALNNGLVSGTIVDNVEVYNTFGYAFYTAAQAGGTNRVENVVHTRIRAFNFQVGIETTGNVNQSWSRDTYADATPQDGGVQIACEALYHEYGAVQSFTRENAVGRGTCGAGILIFTTDGVDVERIVYRNPDIDVEAGSGVFVEGRDGNTINDFVIQGGQVACSAFGGVFRRGNMEVRGTRIVGKAGNGVEAGEDVFLDLHSAEIEGNQPSGGTTAAFGIARDPTATVRWFGSGRLAGIGPLGSEPALTGAIDFIGGPPLLTPGAANAPTRTLLYRIPQSEWIRSNPEDPFQYAVIDLSRFGPSGVAGQALAMIKATVEINFPGPPVDLATSVLWISNLVARVYINSDVTLTDWILKVEVTDYPPGSLELSLV